ncbi:hypothetical protein RB597_006685 [Gaeumannomyces tritici]
MSNADNGQTKAAVRFEGISLQAFGIALATAIGIFAVQVGVFLLFRNKLARIFKPKTFMVPERERTDPPPRSPWNLFAKLIRLKDREIIEKCGLDAYFFLRYLQMLLVIFIPTALVVIPILVPLNYVGGLRVDIVDQVVTNATATTSITSSTATATSSATARPTGSTNLTDSVASNASAIAATLLRRQTSTENVIKLQQPLGGLDTLAWGNLDPKNYQRRWAHLILAIALIVWVCYLMFVELRVYIKVRQDYLTSAQHRLRASANTVLVSSIPEKWLTEDALRGLFDVFPGGIRNIWITRDFTKLLEKVHKRQYIRDLLESAQTDLIRDAKRKQLKRRKADEKKEQKASKSRGPTKEEQQKRDEAEDAEARLRAEGGGGISAGDRGETPDIPTVLDENNVGDDADHAGLNDNGGSKETRPGGRRIISKVGHGIKGGASLVGKAGHGIAGGAKTFQQGVDGQLKHTGGFHAVPLDGIEAGLGSPRPTTRGSDQPHKAVQIADDANDGSKPSFASERPAYRSHTQTSSVASQDMALPVGDTRKGNTTRRASNLAGMVITEETRWWQFWKPPTGGYASPIPQGVEGDEFPLVSKQPPAQKGGEKQTRWKQFVSMLPFVGGDDEPPVDYPTDASALVYSEKRDEDAAWKEWLKASSRPTHRVANFEWTPNWLPGLPLINKKVDTIYWARAELARLNMEIEEDQKHPERYSLMTSAFIQFNHQVAAHMACQSVTHHVPRHMAPRIIEISPSDVLWDNMAISFWSEWLRTGIVLGLVFGMILLWAPAIAATAQISQVDTLINSYPKELHWLEVIMRNDSVRRAVTAIAGVLPAVILAVLLILVPIILNFLAEFQGVKTNAQKSENVQRYYFTFLFVQIFLVIALSQSAVEMGGLLTSNLTVDSVPNLFAEKIPKSANYFFSYMILQALSTSSGTLLQIGTLIAWYVIGRLLDTTARSKWSRQVMLPDVKWGSLFPIYTNFACIALIYAVITPIISIFAVITFSLLWLAHRHNMVYVNRFKTDTGGVLFPTAVNQLFTGLYVMELALIGLFFLQEGPGPERARVNFRQGVIMVVVLICTAFYQLILNLSFSPLFRYLPITFEDEAVLRDEAFQRAQDRRLGLVPDEEGKDADEAGMLRGNGGGAYKEEIELKRFSGARAQTSGGGRGGGFNPVAGVRQAGTWAVRGGKQIHHATIGKAEKNIKTAAGYRRERRMKDLEAQRAMGEALYGGYNDDIEDLTPDERDALVREAFKHEALRARRPVVWIPQDDIGVSNDEIHRTQAFSEYIWMSNEGTALDSKVRVIYGRAPPDFSDVEIINL